MDLIYTENLEVGENPLWDHRRAQLLFLDIRGKCAYRGTPGNFQKITLPQMVGCMAICENGELLFGLEDGVYRMKGGGELTLAHQKIRIKGSRFNDGKVGPDGAFYLGTADDGGRGAFYKLKNGVLTELFEGCACSNGIDWTNDYKTMYYIDSPRQTVEAFDFDITHGTLSNRRRFADIPKEYGLPDGMTLDERDDLWVALWDGHKLVHIDKNSKEIVEEIAFPCPKVSSCAFGGADLSELYVTTAAKSDTDTYPLAGNVFKISTKVRGKKINYYKG